MALKDKKHEYAMEVFERYANARPKEGSPSPTVTVRYAKSDHCDPGPVVGVPAKYVLETVGPIPPLTYRWSVNNSHIIGNSEFDTARRMRWPAWKVHVVTCLSMARR